MDTARELTVGDLVATASLDSTFLAGEGGRDRRVMWAHSCEMPNPEHWLGPHELLMTIGLCVPEGADEQVAFIGRLHAAGLAGVMIGDHTLAPPLSDELLAEADRLDFPVLLAAAQVPYAVVARHVAAANSHEQTLQVLTLSKMYHLAAFAGDDIDTLVDSVAGLLGVGIAVTDSDTGLLLLSSAIGGSESPMTTHEYPLHGGHDATLTVTEYAGEEVDGFILVHLMKVLEVIVDRMLNTAERRAEVSSRLLVSLLNGVSITEATDFLAPHLVSEGFVVVASPASESRAIGRAVAVRALPVLVAESRDASVALVPVDRIAEFRNLVDGVASRAGVSSVFTDLNDVRVATAEASKVLQAAQHLDQHWTEFEGSAVSVLTRSHREAHEIVRGILGPLADSTARSTMLRETLFAFLRNDRKWKETAAELFIHKQTLSYRLGKIEAETGLTVSRSADLSSLWIAYQAWEAVAPDVNEA